jgi:hypothetical protein
MDCHYCCHTTPWFLLLLWVTSINTELRHVGINGCECNKESLDLVKPKVVLHFYLLDQVVVRWVQL